MSATAHVTVRVPLTVRHRSGRKTIVTLDGAVDGGVQRTHADPAMVKALARAFRWKRMLEDGRHTSISEIATAEKIDRGYVGSVLRLTLLAPDIIQAILDGRQPDELSLPALLKPWPLDWSAQRTKWFVSKSTSGEGTPPAVVSSDGIAAPSNVTRHRSPTKTSRLAISNDTRAKHVSS